LQTHKNQNLKQQNATMDVRSILLHSLLQHSAASTLDDQGRATAGGAFIVILDLPFPTGKQSAAADTSAALDSNNKNNKKNYNSFAQLEVHITNKLQLEDQQVQVTKSKNPEEAEDQTTTTTTTTAAAASPSNNNPLVHVLKIKKNHAFKGIRNLPLGEFDIAIVYSNYKTKQAVTLKFPVTIEDCEDVKIFRFQKQQQQEDSGEQAAQTQQEEEQQTTVDESNAKPVVALENMSSYKGTFVEETNQEVIDKYYQLATTGALHDSLIDFVTKKKKQKNGNNNSNAAADGNQQQQKTPKSPLESNNDDDDENDESGNGNDNDDENDDQQAQQQDYFLASQMDMLLNDFDKRTQSKKFNDEELSNFEKTFQEFITTLGANKNSGNNSTSSGTFYDKYAQQIRDHYVIDSEVLKDNVNYYKKYAKLLAKHVQEWPGIRKHNELMSYVGYLIEDLAEIGEQAASKELAAAVNMK